MQQLLDPVFFPRTVDIGDLVFWEAAEKLVYLEGHRGWVKIIETRDDAVEWLLLFSGSVVSDSL